MSGSGGMNDDRRTIEALEAYRSDRDDLSEPELADLGPCLAASPSLAETHRRVERLDAVLSTVIQDVPTPQGLRERILDRLAEASTSAVSIRPAHGPQRSSRRWVLTSVVSTAAAAALVAVIGYWYFPTGYTADEALDRAVAWCQDSSGKPGELLPADLTALLREHPPSTDVILPANTRWQPVDNFLGRPGVAYTMTGWGGARATLLVVPCSRPIPDLGPTAPVSPYRTTGGLAVSAWQTDGLLYILVVEGNSRTYRTFLLPSQPIA
ncbi:MAG: hypothetical protein JW741_10325 [Sedimentisphaerales bacterium]|nr:hypothetical protein [Sedimentisphaerales bacterium]